MSIPAANLLSPADWYRTIRDQIQHEDNLIVQRLSWLMAAQSFFFTGYAIIANASPQARSPLLAKQQDLLFNIIPAVACISDILIFCSVIAGVLALGVELTPRTSMQWVVFRRFTQAGSYGRWEWALRFFSPWFS